MNTAQTQKLIHLVYTIRLSSHLCDKIHIFDNAVKVINIPLNDIEYIKNNSKCCEGIHNVLTFQYQFYTMLLRHIIIINIAKWKYSSK